MMKKYFTRFWRLLTYFIIGFFVSSVFFVLLYRFVNPPMTPLMVMRTFNQVFHSEKIQWKNDWVSLEEISPDLPLAVVASEDNLFLEHHGFDFKAIEKAKGYNAKKKGRKIRGGSTISQQTAKNVFLLPQRSWVRKGLEAYFTILIEFIWPKKRIMEVYLNVIEMGHGIYGAEKSAQIYFNKPASRLTRHESALLAAILPNPLKWSPKRPTSYLMSRQQWILWNMGNIGQLDY
jgi:monofunctional biosynthetic peptidoglycan transglycosylase